jgi:hypothetical protein
LTISARKYYLRGVLEEVELIAQELAGLAEKSRVLEKRLAKSRR